MRSVSPYERYGTATPTSDAKLTVHVFVATETLTSLAERYYGDWREWKRIADRNAIADVRKLVPGTELIIPALPLEVGKYESL